MISAGGGPAEVFVGRRAELQRLEGEWRSVCSGRPRVVWVEGASGMGKSALVRRFLSGAGAFVLRVSGDAGEVSLRYGLVAQVAARMPDGGRSGLPLLAPSGGPPAEADPLAVGAEMLAAFGTLKGSAPVVVVLEDFHWSDRVSSRALLFAARRLQREPVLMLVTCRTVDGSESEDGWRRLASDPESGCRMEMAGLGAPELCRLSEALGLGQLPITVAERLQRHTAGHPLYARAVLEELGPRSLALTTGRLPVPGTLASVVVSRLAGLSQPARDLAAAAAVLGEHSPLPLVSGVAGLTDASAAVEELKAARLLDEAAGGAAGSVAFAHPLIRAAVYGDLPATRRMALHARAAALVGGRGALAHRVAAAGVPDESLAAELDSAAEAAESQGAWEQAQEWFVWGAELSLRPEDRDRRTLAAAQALLTAGDVPRVNAMRPLIAACGTGARRDHVLGWLAWFDGDPSEAAARASDCLWAAEASGEGALCSAAAALLSMARFTQGRSGEAAALARTALEGHPLAPFASRAARYALVLGLAADGQFGAARAAADTLVQRAPRMQRGDALAARGLLLATCDDPQAARADLEEVVRRRREGLPVGPLVAAHAYLGEACFRVGDWAAAQDHAAMAVPQAADADRAWCVAPASAIACWIQAARARFALAEEHVHASKAAAARFPFWGGLSTACAAESFLAQMRGQPERAAAALEPLRTGSVRGLLDALGRLRWRALYAEAMLSMGRLDDAEVMLGEIEDGLPAAPVNGVPLDAIRLRARLEWSRGHADLAEACFRSGLALGVGLMAPFEVARLELELGRLLRESGDRRAALAPLRAARQRLAALGADPLLALCDVQLAACGLRRATPGPANPFDLSPTERSITRLVAKGLTNREIGAEPFVSAKTVEYHLGRIFTKLGVGSRRELRTRVLSAPPDPDWAG